MIFTGPQVHLWFLPFGYVCILLVFLAERQLRTFGLPAFAISLAVASAAMLASSMVLSHRLHIPLAQWAYGVPPVLFALSLRLADGSPRRIGLIAFVVLLTYGVAALLLHSVHASMAMAIGILVGLLGFVVVTPPTAGVKALSALTMPVYLFHPAVLSALTYVIPRGHEGISAMLAIAISALSGIAIYRVGFARQLL